MMSGHGTVETAVEATRLGAFDFVEKPLSLAEAAAHRRARARRRASSKRQTRAHAAAAADAPVGRSRAMQALREQACAGRPARVTGTARGRVRHRARGLCALHPCAEPARRASVRRRCRRQPDERRPPRRCCTAPSSGGRWRRACSSRPMAARCSSTAWKTCRRRRSALLAADIWNSGHVHAGGWQRRRHAQRARSSARRIRARDRAADEPSAATCCPQLNIITLRVPPLREYAEDVPDLLRYYVDRLVDDEGLPFRRFSVAAQNRLRNYPWPGNIRELKNLVQRLLTAGRRRGDPARGDRARAGGAGARRMSRW